ncbi:MAG: VanZ family protein [Anaerolineae bacterium]|jgi:hypothetical protein|nr:VanZ family protein [Anaerolineae bacterium]
MTMLWEGLWLRPVRWLVLTLWMILFIIVLVQPEGRPLIPTGIPPGPQSLERDLFFTALHLIGFGTTTALWAWALGGHLAWHPAVITAVMVALLLSLWTEWAQSFTPDRHPQVSDLIANAAGALLVYAVLRYQHRPLR